MTPSTMSSREREHPEHVPRSCVAHSLCMSSLVAVLWFFTAVPISKCWKQNEHRPANWEGALERCILFARLVTIFDNYFSRKIYKTSKSSKNFKPSKLQNELCTNSSPPFLFFFSSGAPVDQTNQAPKRTLYEFEPYSRLSFSSRKKGSFRTLRIRP
jgi:hypothetical protein